MCIVTMSAVDRESFSFWHGVPSATPEMQVCSFVCVWVRAVGLGYFTAPFVVLLRPTEEDFYPITFVEVLKSFTCH